LFGPQDEFVDPCVSPTEMKPEAVLVVKSRVGLAAQSHLSKLKSFEFVEGFSPLDCSIDDEKLFIWTEFQQGQSVALGHELFSEFFVQPGPSKSAICFLLNDPEARLKARTGLTLKSKPQRKQNEEQSFSSLFNLKLDDKFATLVDNDFLGDSVPKKNYQAVATQERLVDEIEVLVRSLLKKASSIVLIVLCENVETTDLVPVSTIADLVFVRLHLTLKTTTPFQITRGSKSGHDLCLSLASL